MGMFHLFAKAFLVLIYSGFCVSVNGDVSFVTPRMFVSFIWLYQRAFYSRFLFQVFWQIQVFVVVLDV